MKESQINSENDSAANSFQEIVIKYLKFWRWFVIGAFLSLSIAFIYLRYAPILYKTIAKIKIIDDTKETEIASDALSLLGAPVSASVAEEVPPVSNAGPVKDLCYDSI